MDHAVTGCIEPNCKFEVHQWSDHILEEYLNQYSREGFGVAKIEQRHSDGGTYSWIVILYKPTEGNEIL